MANHYYNSSLSSSTKSRKACYLRWSKMRNVSFCTTDSSSRRPRFRCTCTHLVWYLVLSWLNKKRGLKSNSRMDSTAAKCGRYLEQFVTDARGAQWQSQRCEVFNGWPPDRSNIHSPQKGHRCDFLTRRPVARIRLMWRDRKALRCGDRSSSLAAQRSRWKGQRCDILSRRPSARIRFKWQQGPALGCENESSAIYAQRSRWRGQRCEILT